MRARKSVFITCGLSAAALAACSAYDPDLGNSPYLCADQEPRCPDDYTCLDDASGRSVCVQPGGVPNDPPDGPPGFQCGMDGTLEPNNAINQAFQTDVGSYVDKRAFGPISVCPEGDRDHYQINLMTANKGIELITRWTSGVPVSNSILNSAGTSIMNATVSGPTSLRACAPNLPIGQYYAVAYSPLNQKNNYVIEMKVVDNCAP